MNAHDAVTVRSDATNATYHLVAYADESTHSEVSSLSTGESARLSLSRVGDRANVWRADAATPRPIGPATDDRTAGDWPGHPADRTGTDLGSPGDRGAENR